MVQVAAKQRDKKSEEKLCGTIKAAILRGDPDIPSFVGISVYDTKPVHFLSTGAESIEWVGRSHSVWNMDAAHMDKDEILS